MKTHEHYVEVRKKGRSNKKNKTRIYQIVHAHNKSSNFDFSIHSIFILYIYHTHNCFVTATFGSILHYKYLYKIFRSEIFKK